MVSLFASRSFKLIFGIGFILSIRILFLLFSLNPDGEGYLPFFDAQISTIFLYVGILIILNNLSYYRPSNFNYAFLIVWSVFVTFVAVGLSKLLFGLIFKANPAYLTFTSNSYSVRFGIAFLILVVQVGIGLMYYTFQDFKENEERKVEAEGLNKEAELFKLRQQLQPHFLFNSLNSINALIGIKPKEARKMIEQLSDFLRFTTKKEDNQMVKLEEEIQYLSLYLDIEKVRFGHRLTTQINCSEEAKTMKIPALLLQPILENAIKFGLYDTLEPICIELTGNVIGGELILEIKNPYDTDTATLAKGTGFGLHSTRRRLELLYSRLDLLKTETIDNVFVSTLKIPQMKP